MMIPESRPPVQEEPAMHDLSRRDFLYLSLATPAGLARAAAPQKANVHQQLLDLAARQQEQRRARFAAVRSKADLDALQRSLRETFLRLLGGLPERPPTLPVRNLGQIEADDYVIEKLVYESLPGYFVSALLYRPKKVDAPAPGVLSPCGHSATGKAADAYQTLHINLAKRGYVVLTYDPVGQGERSQFWDAARGRSRFNLTCGEHAVLGNPLYLLGGSLARFRIWDGMRGLDYLASRPEVDARRLGCVGNSGGGTLTAYIAALDPRVTVAAICCYITTLPRRMANRIQADPDADPEQDIFGFVGEGIDHAGLLALLAPRPALLGTARFDFFPIEGARESFTEAKHLYEVAGAPEHIARAEAAERHGLTPPLRNAVYGWFERWLAGRGVEGEMAEIAVKPRPAKELLVCAEGQVNLTFQSRPLLPLALEEFDKRAKPARRSLRELLRLDPELADFRTTKIAAGGRTNQILVLCINGNETRGWQGEKDFRKALEQHGCAIVAVDPRGVGSLRPDLAVRGHDYADPLAGVDENIAYNAFLVGKSLLGMRVTDVLAAVRKLATETKPTRLVLCGRRDAALVAVLAAAVEPAVSHVAVEEMPLSYHDYFDVAGRPVNAPSILPGLLRDYGDISGVLAEIAPRPVLIAAGVGTRPRRSAALTVTDGHFTNDSRMLLEWLSKSD
jgi:cephalosporin-C deacetylase-like acetyl esterase